MRLVNEKRVNQMGVSEMQRLLALAICCLCCLGSTWASTSLSDKRLCADPKCEHIISFGTTKISYNSGGEGFLAFKINTPVRIVSKGAGSNPKLWGVEINGRRGYVDMKNILEKRVLVKTEDLKFEVPVGESQPRPVDRVLNASETTTTEEIVGSTTTSPLEVKVENILTEQQDAKPNEQPEPSKAQKVQLVEGTPLPEEENQEDDEDDFEYEDDEDMLEIVDEKPKLEEQQNQENSRQKRESTEELPKVIQNEAPTKEEVKTEPIEAKAIEKEPNIDPEIVKEPPQMLKTDSEPNVEADKPQEKPTPTLPLPTVQQIEPQVISAPALKTETKTEASSTEAEATTTTTAKPLEPLPVSLPPLLAKQNFENPNDYYKQMQEQAQQGLNVAHTTPTPADDSPYEALNDEEPTPAPPIAFDADFSKTETVSPPIQLQQQQMEDSAQKANITATNQPQMAAVDQDQVKDKAEIKEVIPPSTDAAQKEADSSETKHTDAEQVPAAPKLDESAQLELKEAAEENIPEILNVSTPSQPQQAPAQLGTDQMEHNPEIANVSTPSQPQQMENVTPTTQQPAASAQIDDSPLPVAENETVSAPKQTEEAKSESQNEDDSSTKQYQETAKSEDAQIPQMSEELENNEVTSAPIDREDLQPPKVEDLSGSAYVEDVPMYIPAPSSVEQATDSGVGSVEPVVMPSTASPLLEPVKETAGPGLGLFATIVDTVNHFITNQDETKEPETVLLNGGGDGEDELHRLLYPGVGVPNVKVSAPASRDSVGFCSREVACPAPDINLDNFVEILSSKLLDHSQLLFCVIIAAASSLFFMFMYYCFCNSSREGALLAKLNQLERSLLSSHKENHIIKHELMATRQKLASIEDNSFGSNDMVASLKKQLETELYEKAKLQEQVGSLERDLDNAAEAGLELNKMLSEVLNSQNGDEAFMSTVDELQRQLNDQEKIILDINSSLAEKSRENSELQYSYTEATARLTSEMKSLQQDNYELEMEKAKLQTRLEEIQTETEQELARALEARNYEMQKLQNQILELNSKWEKAHNDLQTSLAKIEALEDCLKTVKKDTNLNVHELISSAKTRGELNAAQKKFTSLEGKLEQESNAKARLEMQLKQSSSDVEQLKQDFNQAERDKLEAQTRLEVLSGYFREKETQLQKELTLQEAKWLQHQGENASTVETQTLMKNEIQTLKSQNDELRAEIEAQIASHKAQMGTLENRAHESWLAARQSERRCEEALAEAAGLRRKLTTMASGGGVGIGGGDTEVASSNGGEMKAAPSPLPLVPGSPLLNLPNPLPFLAAPFSPFMGLPPPFLPPAGAGGGARPPPLGRMRSPPPADRDRYSDYSDYDDYDDDEEDERGSDRRRRHSGSWGRGGGHRDSYMHSPRTYRSLSPSDSRYNYNDTETDFSPPPSPPPRTRHGSGGGGNGGSRGSRPISEV